MSRLDVQVHQVEDYSVGQIAKTAVVDDQTLSGIDHLKPCEHH
jgi:hypothetical protein